MTTCLDELGIKVAVPRELPKVQRAYQGYLRQQRDAYRVGMVKPTAEQQSVEKLFPAIAQWVRGYGYIEIGDQEMFGFVARPFTMGTWPSRTTDRTRWPRHWLPRRRD